MQHKNVFVAVGAAAYGALVSWAVTADRYEQKLKDTRKYYNTYNIYNNTNSNSGPWTLSDEDLQRFKMGVETHESEVQLDSGGRIEVIRDQDDTLRTRTLQTEEGKNSASGAEIPRGDETSEADEAGVTDDEDSIPPGETEEQTRQRLESIISPYVIKDDTEGQIDVPSVAAIMEHQDTSPYVISQALFSSDPDEGDLYDKETLTYYPRQRVLLDDDQVPVDDIATTVGWKNLNQFGGESNQADVVYIRNRRLATDYEVEREEEASLPLHVQYHMPKAEFETAKAAGVLRLRPEDMVD